MNNGDDNLTDFEIKAFFEIVQCGSITKAAEILNITQSALSHRLMALEESLGYPLLVRQKGSRTITLTEQGKKFYGIAQKWMALWKEAVAIPNVQNRPILRIVSTDSINSFLLPDVLKRYCHDNPDVCLELRNRPTRDVFGLVEDGIFDIGIATDMVKIKSSVNVDPLCSEPLVCIAGSQAEYPDGITPDKLDPYREVRYMNVPTFNSWHDYWFPEKTSPYIYSDKLSIGGGFPLEPNNWTIAPNCVAQALHTRHNMKIIDIASPPPPRIIYTVTQGGAQSLELRRFVAALQKYLKEINGFSPL